MWKFAVLIKTKFKYVLNCRAVDIKSRVEKHFLLMFLGKLKEKDRLIEKNHICENA
jgi:hypothetical protein